MQAPGDAFARLALARETVEGLDARRYDAYGELGLLPSWTLSAKAEYVAFEDAGDFNAEGYRLSLRRSLYARGGVALAVEGGAVYGAAIGGLRGCEEPGAELRVSGGASGRWEGADWFVFADVASRVHSSGCARDRIEIGAGQELLRNLFLTNQLWLERGNDGSQSAKIETGLIYRMRRTDASLAWREEVSGRFEEEAIVLSIARRF